MKPYAEYKKKVITWATGKKFTYLGIINIEKKPPRCDACGTKKARVFYIIADQDHKSYLIGKECFFIIYKDASYLDTKGIDRYEREAILDQMIAKYEVNDAN